MADVLFSAAFPFQEDVLTLPVADLDQAADYYCDAFGLTEIRRESDPVAKVVLARDGVEIGFAITGADPTQDGAAILVTDIERAARELGERGIEIGNRRIDERDGESLDVFFVVAPDGLCYYFHQPIASES